MTYPLPDGDSGWQAFTGTVRVRVHTAGAVQLQISAPHGDGTFDVATIVLNGTLRDVRNSATAFPGYAAPTTPRFKTDADRIAGAKLAAQAKGRVTSGGALAPPVSG